jgi:cytoskeleton protein RodZ
MRSAASEAAGDGRVESFGTRLKKERERRKITLEDISVSTKIGTRFLTALEEDQFDQLPGGIFNKGFVRSYARHLGLDEAQTISDFEAASAPAVPESPPLDAPVLEAMAVRVPESVRKRREKGGIPWEAFALTLLIAAFFFALWGFHSRQKPRELSESLSSHHAADTPTATEPANSQRHSPEPAAPGAEIASPVAVTSNTGAFVVQITARQAAWVAITADGQQTVEDTLSASAQKSIEAHTQVVVKTGNVGALDISFNGKKLASQGSYNQVKTLTFDPNGLRP